ncbi:MAG: nucleoside kinase [Bacteroidales bacterium]|nr:nucleoside kinase [Bacteroidales bacterium]
MDNFVKVTCLNNRLSKDYKLGTSLAEIAKDMGVETKYPILGARINNKLSELSYLVYNPKFIEFIDISNIDGYRMYQRSLSFVLMKATRDTFPDAQLKIEHSISKGFYCVLEKETKLLPEDVLKIAERMRQIVKSDLPFKRNQIPTEDAIEKFREFNLLEKVKLFETRPTLFTSVYSLDNQIDYFHGFLVPSTGYLKIFDLIPYYDGMLLRFPSPNNPEELGEVIEQQKLFEIFQEFKDWSEILGVSTIGSINEAVQNGRASELIKVSEALNEKKVALIADEICERKDVKLVLIAGPSSSGKTTFSKRLAIQLKVLGINSLPVSIDNFFVNREDTPKDENGEYDYESLYALDLDVFNTTMNNLIEGKPTVIPGFDFHSGQRVFKNTESVILPEKSVLIVEGIHGLNPKLSEHIDSKLIFKVYVSALTQLGIDWHNRIPSTDNRLIRRLVRDFQYRGYSPVDTLKRWPSVRSGEDKNIFPFQEEANVMFNSALLYELGILKKYAEPLLKKVPENVPEFSEAKRLLKFLSYFVDIEEDEEIPPTSILREFLHGSSFHY